MYFIYLHEELMHMLSDDYLNINIISYCTVGVFLVIDASLWRKKQLFWEGNAIMFRPPPEKKHFATLEIGMEVA